MKIGFDIGGVISKYPEQFRELIYKFCEEDFDNILNSSCCGCTDQYGPDWSNVFIITDMHPKEEVIQVLKKNDIFGWKDTVKWNRSNDKEIEFPEKNVYCADYEKHGNMAKAILIKELGLDIFIDDFDGYLQWDSSLGPQPILLKVMPDAFKPYWADDWKCNGGEFGRRKYAVS